MLFRKPYYKVLTILNHEYRTTTKRTDDKAIPLTEAVEITSMTADAVMIEHSKLKRHIIIRAVDNKLLFERID